MSIPKSGLPYDELGFLIGLKQTGRDVAKIDQNVEAIHDILLKLQKEFESKLGGSESQFKPKLSALEQALIDAQIKPIDISDIIKEQVNPIIHASVVLDRVAKTIEDLIDESTKNNKVPKTKTTQAHNKAVEIDSPESVIGESTSERRNKQDVQAKRDSIQRKRDANGRFIGEGAESENKSKLGKVIQTIGTAFKEVMPNTPHGVDPTVDAINEVATVLSPVKRAAGFMLRPLTGWMKSRKRNEPLPKEQSDHNRKQIKLLQRLVDNLQSKGGVLGSIGKLLGAGGGILASLFGGILKNGGKLLKFGKGLPIIGALLTAMSFSDWGTKSTKEKGGAIGGTAGGLIGGAIGSLFGPLGTVAGAGLGSIIGEKIGSVAAPYIKQWTDSLISADIPTMISKLISAALKLTPGGIAKSLVDWGKEKWNSTFNGQPNPSYLMRRQYGGQGVNGGEPAQFGAAANSSTLGKNLNGRKEAFKFFTDKGWSKEQAAGIVANLQHESNFNTKAVGDGGKAVGIAQWHPDRQANFKKAFGKNLKDASFQEQLEFIHYEMTKGTEQNAGAKLKEAKTASEAGAVVSKYYERPLLRDIEANKRADSANKVLKEAIDSEQNSKDGKPEPVKDSNSTNQTIKDSAVTIVQKAKNQVSLLNNQPALTPLASRPNSIGSSFNTPMVESKIEPSKEYFSPKEPQKVQVVGQNNGSINQNVSNRVLAHAITGGLGMGDQWNV
ncbi:MULTISPECIES: phage tail tip lysozyme [unclassified Acinetobacter]|uniref:phage tail tip lysozyme n=1 Tax=unclassified Acinetobacter TaxID=196816 RepID=UPI00124F2BED|nr:MULTISPECIES: phage tail tip lysozyme [unclassified Acinetobacter]